MDDVVILMIGYTSKGSYDVVKIPDLEFFIKEYNPVGIMLEAVEEYFDENTTCMKFKRIRESTVDTIEECKYLELNSFNCFCIPGNEEESSMLAAKDMVESRKDTIYLSMYTGDDIPTWMRENILTSQNCTVYKANCTIGGIARYLMRPMELWNPASSKRRKSS